MATRSLWGVAAKFMAVGTAVAGGNAGATILTSDYPPVTFKLWTNGPVRLFRDAFTAASIAFGMIVFHLKHPYWPMDQLVQSMRWDGRQIFAKFDPVPIASASLAQVHVAQLHNGQKVAVKVQYAHMTDTAAADYATVELIVNTLHRLFPNFDYRYFEVLHFCLQVNIQSA
uniref:ABC1 atypical kinase-like domain-containing protein n=1 Tax=Chenopodium quinoa TaxID=63459 RepID=A0A803MHM5_CHEQI